MNQYTTIGDFTPQFDAAGNQTRVKTSTGIWQVSYNAENRPVRFESEDGSTVVECTYDYMGRRATKKATSNGKVTLHQCYLYRGYLQIACCDHTRSTTPCLWLITWESPRGFGGGLDKPKGFAPQGRAADGAAASQPTQPISTRPLAIRKDGTWYVYGWDLTKNICEIYGPTGYIRTLYTYSPYGIVTAEGDVTQPIQWSSEFNDIELGLVYYNYRHYNPSDGRWIFRDLLGEYIDINLYTFTGNSAFQIDGLGLSILDDVKNMIPRIEGYIGFSYMFIFPIAPPAVSVNVTISITGEGSYCCDKSTHKQKLLLSATVSGEGSLGLGNSIKGKKYQPKGRGSKWQNANNGRFAKKPERRGRERGISSELYGSGDNYCPTDWWDGSVSVGARGTIGAGYGLIIDINYTFPINEEGNFSVSARSGFVIGARVEAYVSLSASLQFIVDVPLM